MIYTPRYLNMQTASTMSEAYGVEIRPEANLRERSQTEGGGGIGVNVGAVQAGLGGGGERELEATYRSTTPPGVIVSNLLETLNEKKAALHPSEESHLQPRGPVELEGSLTIHPITDLAGLLEPLLSAAMVSGDLNESDMMAAVMGSDTKAETALLVLDPEDVDDLSFIMVADRSNLLADSFEALEGHMTVLGVLEKVVPTGSSFPLDRFAMPHLSRPLRRAMGDASILDLTEKLPGYDVSPEDLSFVGPGGRINVAAIYS